MKLNKMELRAVALQICDDLKKKHDELHKAHIEQSDKNNLAYAKAILRQLDKLPVNLKDHLRFGKDKYNSRLIVEVDIPFLLNELRKPFVAPFYVPNKHSDDIVNKLIVAQIDCPDLSTLIDRVTNDWMS